MVKPKASDILVATVTTAGLLPVAYAATIKHDISYKEYSSFAMNFQQYFAGSTKAISYVAGNIAKPLNFNVPNFVGVSDKGNSALLDSYQFLATSTNAQLEHATTFSKRYLANPFISRLFSAPEGKTLSKFVFDEFVPSYTTVTASIDDTANFKIARQNTIITDAYGISYIPPEKVTSLVKKGALVATVNAGPIRTAIYNNLDEKMTDSYLFTGGVNSVSDVDIKLNDQNPVLNAHTEDNDTLVPLRFDDIEGIAVKTTLKNDNQIPLGIVSSAKADLGSPLFIWDAKDKNWSYLGANVYNEGHGYNASSIYASTPKHLHDYINSFNYVIDKEGKLDFFGTKDFGASSIGYNDFGGASAGTTVNPDFEQVGFTFNGVKFNDDAQAKNIIFTKSNAITLHDAVNTGVGYLRFSKSGLIQGDANASLQTAGIIVDDNVSLTVNLEPHGPAHAVKQVWRKMGNGTLILTNTGSDNDDLYVGQGTVILNKVGGHAVKNLHLTNGDSHVVFTKAYQVQGEHIFFGTHGGELDLDGFDLHTSQIYHIDHGAVIANNDNTKCSTFTLVNTVDSSKKIPERMYLGTFKGNLNVNFDLGTTNKLSSSIELRGYDTNITGNINIVSGNVKIMGDSIYDSSDYSSIYGVYSCATVTAKNINVYNDNSLILSRGSHVNAQINLEPSAQLIIQTRGVVNDKLRPWFKGQSSDWQVDWNRIDINKDIYFNTHLYHTHSSTGHQVPHPVLPIVKPTPIDIAPTPRPILKPEDLITTTSKDATSPTDLKLSPSPTDDQDFYNGSDLEQFGTADQNAKPDVSSASAFATAATAGSTTTSDHAINSNNYAYYYGNLGPTDQDIDQAGTSPDQYYSTYTLHQNFLINLDNNHQARVLGSLYGKNVLIEKQGLGKIAFLGTDSKITGNLLIDEGQVHFANAKAYDQLQIYSENPYAVLSIGDVSDDPKLTNLIKHLDNDFTGIINLNNNATQGIDQAINKFEQVSFGTTGNVVIGNNQSTWARGIDHLYLGANGGTLHVNGLFLDKTKRNLIIGNDDTNATVILDKVEADDPLNISVKGEHTLLVIKDNQKHNFIDLPYETSADYSVHKGITKDSSGVLYITNYSKVKDNTYNLDGVNDASLGVLPWQKLDIDHIKVVKDQPYSFTASQGGIINLNFNLENGHNLVADGHYNNNGTININADNSNYQGNEIILVDNFIGEPDKHGNNGSIQVNLYNNNALGLGNKLSLIGHSTLNLNGFNSDVFLMQADSTAEIKNTIAAYEYINFAEQQLHNQAPGSSQPKYTTSQLKAPIANFTIYNPKDTDISIDAKITGRINLIFNGTANYQLTNPYNNIEGDYIVNSGTLYDLNGGLSRNASRSNVYINDNGSLVLAHDFSNYIYVNLHSYYRNQPVIEVPSNHNVTINGLVGHSDILVAGGSKDITVVNISHINTNGHALYLKDLTIYNPSVNDPQSKQVGIYEGRFLSKDQLNESHYATVNNDGLHIDVNNDGIDDTASNVILVNAALEVSGDSTMFDDANKLSTLVLSNSVLTLNDYHANEDYHNVTHGSNQTLISVLGEGNSYINLTGKTRNVLSQRLQLDDRNTVLTIQADNVSTKDELGAASLKSPTGLINNLALKGYGTLNFNLPEGAYGSTVVYNSPDFAGTVDFSANQYDPNLDATISFDLQGTTEQRTIKYSIAGNKNTTLRNTNPTQALYLGNLTKFQGTVKIRKDDAPIIFYGDSSKQGLGFTIDTEKENLEFNVSEDDINYLNDFTLKNSTDHTNTPSITIQKTGTGVLVLGDQIHLGNAVKAINVNQGSLLLDGANHSAIFSDHQNYTVQTYGTLGFAGSENVTLCSTVTGNGSFAVVANNKETTVTTDLDHLQVKGAYNLIRGTLRINLKDPELNFNHKVVGTELGVLELVNDFGQKATTTPRFSDRQVVASSLAPITPNQPLPSDLKAADTQYKFASIILNEQAVTDLKNFKGSIKLNEHTGIDFTSNKDVKLPELSVSSNASASSQIRNLGSANLTLNDLHNYSGDVYAVNGDVVLVGSQALSSHATLIEQNNKRFYLSVDDVALSESTGVDANPSMATSSNTDDIDDSNSNVLIRNGQAVPINDLLDLNYVESPARSNPTPNTYTNTNTHTNPSPNAIAKAGSSANNSGSTASAAGTGTNPNSANTNPNTNGNSQAHAVNPNGETSLTSQSLIKDPSVTSHHINLNTLVDISTLKTNHTVIHKVGTGAIQLSNNATFRPDQINIDQGSLVLQTNLYDDSKHNFNLTAGASLVLDLDQDQTLVGNVMGAGNLVLAKDTEVKASQVSNQTVIYTNNQTLVFNLDQLVCGSQSVEVEATTAGIIASGSQVGAFDYLHIDHKVKSGQDQTTLAQANIAELDKANDFFSHSVGHNHVGTIATNSGNHQGFTTDKAESFHFIHLPTFVGTGKVVLSPTALTNSQATTSAQAESNTKLQSLNLVINGNLNQFRGTIETDTKVNLFVQSANTVLTTISGNGTIVSDLVDTPRNIYTQSTTSIVKSDNTDNTENANHTAINTATNTASGTVFQSTKVQPHSVLAKYMRAKANPSKATTASLEHNPKIKLSASDSSNNSVNDPILLFADNSGFSGKLIASKGDIAVVSTNLTTAPTYIIDQSNLLLADATTGTLDLSKYKIYNPTGSNFLINVVNRNLSIDKATAQQIKNIALSQGELDIYENLSLAMIENAATINLANYNITVDNFNSVGGHINLVLDQPTDQARIKVNNPVNQMANQNLNLNLQINDQTRKLLTNTTQKLVKTAGHVNILNLDQLNQGHIYKLVLSSGQDHTITLKSRSPNQDHTAQSDQKSNCNSVINANCDKGKNGNDYNIVALTSSHALNLLQLNDVVRAVQILPPPNLAFTNTVSVGVINSSFIDKTAHTYTTALNTTYQNRSFVDGFTISSNHNINFSPRAMFNLWGDYRHTEIDTRTKVNGLEASNIHSGADTVNLGLALKYQSSDQHQWYVGSKVGYSLMHFDDDNHTYKIGYLAANAFGTHSYQFYLPYQFDLELRNELGFNYAPLTHQNLTRFADSSLAEFKTKSPYSFNFNNELKLSYGKVSLGLDLGVKYDLTSLVARSIHNEELVDSTTKRFSWNSAVKLNFAPNQVMILSLGYNINNEFKSVNQSFQVDAGFKW